MNRSIQCPASVLTVTTIHHRYVEQYVMHYNFLYITMLQYYCYVTTLVLAHSIFLLGGLHVTGQYLVITSILHIYVETFITSNH